MMKPSVLGHGRVMNPETAWARVESSCMEHPGRLAPGLRRGRRVTGVPTAEAALPVFIIPTSLLLLTLPIFIVLLFVSFRCFDRLLRLQVACAQQEWQDYGSPSGYFWSPPGAVQWSLRWKGRLWSHWFVHPPGWIRTSFGNTKEYWQFRLVAGLATISFVLGFIGLVQLCISPLLWLMCQCTVP